MCSLYAVGCLSLLYVTSHLILRTHHIRNNKHSGQVTVKESKVTVSKGSRAWTMENVQQYSNYQNCLFTSQRVGNNHGLLSKTYITHKEFCNSNSCSQVQRPKHCGASGRKESETAGAPKGFPAKRYTLPIKIQCDKHAHDARSEAERVCACVC